MSEPTGRSRASSDEDEALDEEEAAAPAAPPSIDALRDAGDVDALLALARAYRSGTEGPARDMGKCLACYRAAATLGSPEADYAVALFLMSGGVLEQNLKEGATHLRTAADRGHLGAKVYVANLYELGVHYAQDTAKADVWYRSAARAADVASDPGTPEHTRAMAELGAVRYVLALADDPATSEAERDRWLRKARATGYQLKLRSDRARESLPSPSSATPTPAPASPAATAAPAAPATAAKRATAATKKTTEEVEAAAVKAVKQLAKDNRPPATASLGAFAFALLFSAAGLGAGVGARAGLHYLVGQGTAPAVLADRGWLVLPAVYVLIGVLPAFLAYRGAAVLRAVALGAIGAVAGWFLWATQPLLASRDMQSVAFAAAAFLATLFVLGFLGGAKARRR